jgi:hypothetical protein
MKLTKEQAATIAFEVGAKVAAALGEKVPGKDTNYVSSTFIAILATKYASTGELETAAVTLITDAAKAEGGLFNSYSEAKQIRYAISAVLGWPVDDTSNPDGTPTDAAAKRAAIKDAQNRIDDLTKKLKKTWPAQTEADLRAQLKKAQDDLAAAEAS